MPGDKKPKSVPGAPLTTPTPSHHAGEGYRNAAETSSGQLLFDRHGNLKPMPGVNSPTGAELAQAIRSAHHGQPQTQDPANPPGTDNPEEN